MASTDPDIVQEFVQLLQDFKYGNIQSRITRGTSFDMAMSTLGPHARLNGLSNAELVQILRELGEVTKLGLLNATRLQSIVMILIPRKEPSEEVVDLIMAWLMDEMHTMPLEVAKTLMWLAIGLLELNLVDAESLGWTFELLFSGFSCPGLETPTAKLIQLLTTPDLIHRFQVSRLLRYQQTTRRYPVTALLSYFKMLRPDKVPESVPLLTEIRLSKSRAYTTIGHNLALARARCDATPQDDPVTDVGRLQRTYLKWGLGSMLKKRSLLPPLTFDSASTDKALGEPVRVIDNKTLEELFCNVLTSEGPQQALSLLSLHGGHVFLQFSPDVRERFLFNLHHLLRHVVEGRLDRGVGEAEVLALLQQLAAMQEAQQRGSVVVTRFVSQFFRHNGAVPTLLPVLLRLVTWAEFTSFAELYASVLKHLKEFFSSSGMNTQAQIVLSVGQLIIHKVIAAKQLSPSQLRDEAVGSIKGLHAFLVTLIQTTLRTDKLCSTGAVLTAAIQVHREVAATEQRTMALDLWTVPPVVLMAACLMQSQAWLLEEACELLLIHKKGVFNTSRDDKFTKQKERLRAIENSYITQLIHAKDLKPGEVLLGSMVQVPQETQDRLSELAGDGDQRLHRTLAMAPYHLALRGQPFTLELAVKCSSKYFPSLHTLLKEHEEQHSNSVPQ